MHVLLCADYYAGGEDLFFLCGYDSSFRERYCKEGRGLQGEEHWEADKYNIFYLKVDDGRVGELVKQCRGQDWCYVVAEINEQYAMTDNCVVQNGKAWLGEYSEQFKK